MRDEYKTVLLIPHPSSLIPHPSSLILPPSSLLPHPSSLIPHPSSLIYDYGKRKSYFNLGPEDHDARLGGFVPQAESAENDGEPGDVRRRSGQRHHDHSAFP